MNLESEIQRLKRIVYFLQRQVTTSGSGGAAPPSGFANPMTSLGDIIYGGTSGTPTRLAGSAGFLKSTGAAAPVWSAIAGSDVTGVALTKTDDTNVTLTLGGTPATSLLRAASLTLGWTGTLAVSRGGLGVGTVTGVLIGNGTSAVSAVAGTGGQLLRRNAGNTAYEFFTPTYLTTNQTITLSGAVTGSGATAITTTLANSIVGVANLSATGTPSPSTYLRGDNTWATITTGSPSSGTNDLNKSNGSGGLTLSEITSGTLGSLSLGSSTTAATDRAINIVGTQPNVNLTISSKGTGALTLLTNGLERLVINGSGAVGFGGTNYGTAGQVLTSQGSSAVPTWTSATSQWTTSGANIYYNTGDVGIGTGATVQAALEVVKSSAIHQLLRSTSTTGYTSLRLYNDLNSSGNALEIDYSGSAYSGSLLTSGATGQAAAIATTGAFPLMLGTNNTARVTINSSGNFGINETSPSARLEVKGTGTTTGSLVVFKDSASTERVKILDDGSFIVSSNTFYRYQAAQIVKTGAATLTGAELMAGILNTVGGTYTITLPTGTNIDSADSSGTDVNHSFDWSVVNGASGTITIGANGNSTLGSMNVSTGTSALFRFRKTAANTYTVYRIS
jgi:hypothetical protein